MRQPAGFSLIHLVMVIVVIGILAALIGEYWPGKGSVVYASTQRLANDLRYARHYAISHEYAVRVTFNASAGTYQFTRDSDASAISFAGQQSSTVSLDSSVMSMSLSNLPNQYVIFDNDGKAYTASGVALSSNATITLSGSGKTGRVTISAHSGAIVTPLIN